MAESILRDAPHFPLQIFKWNIESMYSIESLAAGNY